MNLDLLESSRHMLYFLCSRTRTFLTHRLSMSAVLEHLHQVWCYRFCTSQQCADIHVSSGCVKKFMAQKFRSGVWSFGKQTRTSDIQNERNFRMRGAPRVVHLFRKKVSSSHRIGAALAEGAFRSWLRGLTKSKTLRETMQTMESICKVEVLFRSLIRGIF
jgi:hypothetical protein